MRAYSKTEKRGFLPKIKVNNLTSIKCEDTTHNALNHKVLIMCMSMGGRRIKRQFNILMEEYVCHLCIHGSSDSQCSFVLQCFLQNSKDSPVIY